MRVGQRIGLTSSGQPSGRFCPSLSSEHACASAKQCSHFPSGSSVEMYTSADALMGMMAEPLGKCRLRRIWGVLIFTSCGEVRLGRYCSLHGIKGMIRTDTHNKKIAITTFPFPLYNFM